MARGWRGAIAAAAILPAALAWTAGVAGCDGGGDRAGAAHVPTNEINPQPREQVRDGGRLTWSIDAYPADLNIYRTGNAAGASGQDAARVLGAVLPYLYDVDAAGNPVWNRDYLAAEPALTDQGGQVVTYRINPKAVWSDGAPLTWEDFKWQWRAASGVDASYDALPTSGYDRIGKVERGADDREVKVSFAKRYADWRTLFDPLYPAATNRDPKLFNSAWRGAFGPTAGPFKAARVDPAGRTITLVRDDRWWGDRAKLDEIVFRALDGPAQVSAFVDGTADLAAVSDATGYAQVKAAPNGAVRRAGAPGFSQVTFNGASPVLSDVRVRRALARAIDRGAIASAALSPLGAPAQPLNNHLYLAGQAAYRDNSGVLGGYDRAAAQQLLDEAGWKLDGAVRKRDGRALEINLVIPAGVTTSRQAADLITANLAQVGAVVKTTQAPQAAFFDQYVRPGRFDLTVFSWRRGADLIDAAYPVGGNRSVYTNPKKTLTGQLDIQQNYARVGSDLIDGLFDRAAGELDPAVANSLGNEIDTALWQEVHSLPLYQQPELVACRTGLANAGASGFATVKYQNVGWQKS